MKKLLIVLAVLLLAAPTMAAEWNFYGSARLATFSTDIDMDVPGQDSDRDTLWDDPGNSRIGANVKFNDQISGKFEYGSASSINKRQLFGKYNFGVGELLVGQTYTPTSEYFYSTSVYATDNNLFGIGQFYAGRQPMLRLKFGELKLAFVKPNTVDYDVVKAVGPYTLNATKGTIDPTVKAVAADTDVTFPKVELSYGYKGEMFFVDVFGGYQTTEYENPDGGGSEDIDAYVVGIGAGVTVGPVWFNAGFHMGQNLGNYGNVNGAFIFDDKSLFLTKAVASYDAVTGEFLDLEDQDGLGYLAVLGFQANDMLTFEAGYGRQETEIDEYEADVTQYYLLANIQIAKGVYVVPEIGMFKYSEDGVSEEPDALYMGAKWQINF